MSPTLRIGAVVAVVAMAAACSPDPSQEPAEATPVAVGAPDYGRGGFLTQAVDRIEQRRQQAAASGELTPAEAEAVSQELSAVRTTLAELLSKDPGPLAPADRQLIAQRLQMIEAQIDRAPSP
jgi:hypothetical protein